MDKLVNNHISMVSNRSSTNINEIKQRLRQLDKTLSNLTTARNNLIDAIVRDAGEAINFWQLEIVKLKQTLINVIKNFVTAIDAQERTIASLDILTSRYNKDITLIKDAITKKQFRKWPSMWGGKSLRQSFTGDTVNVDTSWGTLPKLPKDYGTGTGQTTGSPYTKTELIKDKWLN